MVCAFIDTFCEYTAWFMLSLRRCSRCGGGIPVGCGGSGRLVVDVGWRRCDGRKSCGWGRLTALLLGDCWECACSSLRLACWGVLFSEDRWSQRVHLAGSRWSLRRPAPVGVAAYRTCRANCTTGMCVLTGREASGWLWRLSCLFLHPYVYFSILLSWGEIPYVLPSGLPRKPLVTIPV
jgi:hypothetical protein